MKKHILFIAEYNNILKELYTSLEDIFDVQMCLPTVNAIKKSLSVYMSDMILVNISGISNDEFQDTVRTLGMNVNQHIPVVVLGTIEECEEFNRQLQLIAHQSKNVTDGNLKLHNIYRPLTNGKIIEKLQRKFCLTPDEEANGVKRILMIDDDAMMIRFMAKQLEPKYKIIASTSGSDGLAKMESQKPDAVFLDYEMPGFNGEQILRMIHENELIKDIPIYMLTGKADKETVTALLALKPNGYFLKNGDINLIKKTLDKLFAE
ncbi:MAG: response regulator [Lachnospiraceae bacterium]|nr:response regulator [Lachnospiraceae bacterium]